MELYHPTKGLKGIRSVLNQFNEATLSDWQRSGLRERLLILSWYDHNGCNQVRTALEFNTSRSHIQKLLKIRLTEGLGGLIPVCTGPKHKRGTELTSDEKREIERYASWFPDWGHKKLRIFFSQHSASTVYRYLAEKELLVRNRCPGFHKKPTPRSAWKIKRIRLPEDYPVNEPGDLVVLDSIIEYIGSNFKKLYFVCCTDIATRISIAVATDHHSSVVASEVLKKMSYVLQTDIKAVLTDNGSEFLAYFQKACTDEGIEHFFSRPRTPKDNPVAERFNKSLQQGFYWRCDLTQSLHQINAALADWLIEFNTIRPHESLSMRPPAALYFSLFYRHRLATKGVHLKLWNRTRPPFFKKCMLRLAHMGKIVKQLGKVCAVVGGQWGDEGKGKLIDILADEYDIIVRATGGANAGHSIYIDKKKSGKHVAYEKVVFHLIPSGMFHPKKICLMGNGIVMHFPTLFEEIEVLKKHGVRVDGRLFLSPRAHIVFEYHKILDKLLEERKGKGKVGTTGRGIGPAYTDKISRNGIRVEELDDFEAFGKHYLENVEQLKRNYDVDYETKTELGFFKKHHKAILSLFRETSAYLYESLSKGKSILLEGANGTLLDIDHGTYPFVTSSNASLGGLIAGCGIPPSSIMSAIGIMKAYVTRVGAGPFPTEIHDRLGEQIREQGDEYGSTTGRPRRCGWFDMVGAKYAAAINGFTAINLTKLDVLTGVSVLKIGVSYKHRGKKLLYFPTSAKVLDECKVDYLELPGWTEELNHAKSFSELPKNCRRYVETIEKLLKVPVRFIGTGLTRKHMIVR